MSKSIPFEYINGLPFDKDNYRHRDIVIERNKRLEKALTEGVILDDKKLFISIKISVELECLKCGTEINAKENLDSIVDVIHFDTYDYMPNMKCKCCGTKYKFDETNLVYQMYVPVKSKIAKK